MELHELGIIYTKVPNFMSYSDGKIMELFIIHKKNEAIFLVNVDFKDANGKKKMGLFNLDLENKRLNYL